jgi:hypothetical protein
MFSSGNSAPKFAISKRKTCLPRRANTIPNHKPVPLCKTHYYGNLQNNMFWLHDTAIISLRVSEKKEGYSYSCSCTNRSKKLRLKSHPKAVQTGAKNQGQNLTLKLYKQEQKIKAKISS